MSRFVAVVDYGMGNLRSVSQAVRHAAADSGWDVRVTAKPEEVRAAERVVLPGQGAMRDCMSELRNSGLQEAVLEAAASKPLFGVCVGMQMLLDHSEEQDTPGLGVIPGNCLRFRLEGQTQPDGSRYKVPQMGWNEVFQTARHPIWAGVPDASHFYFVHSYYVQPASPALVTGEAEYAQPFCVSLAEGKVFAVQFHPEKSQDAGLQLLQNFLGWDGQS